MRSDRVVIDPLKGLRSYFARHSWCGQAEYSGQGGLTRTGNGIAGQPPPLLEQVESTHRAGEAAAEEWRNAEDGTPNGGGMWNGE